MLLMLLQHLSKNDLHQLTKEVMNMDNYNRFIQFTFNDSECHYRLINEDEFTYLSAISDVQNDYYYSTIEVLTTITWT